MSAEALLQKLGIRYERRGRKLLAVCPNPEHRDRKPSWAAWEDDRGRVWHRCLACDFGGGQALLVRVVLGAGVKIGKLTDEVAIGEVVVEEMDRTLHGVEVPEDVIVAPFDEWPDAPRVYLAGRGWTAETVERWGAGFSVQAERVWIPIEGEDRRLEGWTARSWVGADPKYWTCSRKQGARPGALFGCPHWKKAHEAVVVVEGPFDCVAVSELGFSAAALTGSYMHPDQARKLARFPIIVVATDPDKAGTKAATLVSGLGRWSRIGRALMPEGMDPAALYADQPYVLARRIRAAITKLAA